MSEGHRPRFQVLLQLWRKTARFARRRYSSSGSRSQAPHALQQRQEARRRLCRRCRLFRSRSHSSPCRLVVGHFLCWHRLPGLPDFVDCAPRRASNSASRCPRHCPASLTLRHNTLCLSKACHSDRRDGAFCRPGVEVRFSIARFLCDESRGSRRFLLHSFPLFANRFFFPLSPKIK
jgi:hypothetical protein